MDDFFNNMKSYGSISIIFLSMLMIFVSGLFFGITYFVMDSVQDSFENTDCVISDNLYVDSCQDLWELSIYPFLALKSLLVWGSFFFIFALVIGMLLLGYQSGNNPVLMGFLITIVIIATYTAMYVSNIYRILLDNPLFRSMMTEFTVYNKIMLSFPWFIFIISLFAFILSIVNWQRTRVNSPKDAMNY
jgi:hypothetical protein